MPTAILKYLREVEKIRAAGNATEHTYRPAFKTLVESFGKSITAARNLWVPAVNNANTWGRWAFIEISDPWDAKHVIEGFLAQTSQAEKGSEKC
jgi:hypothetical protein